MYPILTSTCLVFEHLGIDNSPRVLRNAPPLSRKTDGCRNVSSFFRLDACLAAPAGMSADLSPQCAQNFLTPLGM